MSVAKVIDWDGLMSKIGTPVVKNMFAKKKAKGAKVAQMMATYPGTPAAIDFSSYTGKLAFTKFAVADIEAAYKKGPVLPPKHEGPSELELAKRAASLAFAADVAAVAKTGVTYEEMEIETFESAKLGPMSDVEDLTKKFPGAAKVDEKLMGNRDWAEGVGATGA